MSDPVERVRRMPGAAFRTLGDQVIVAPPAGEEFEILAGTAVAVWALLDEPRTVKELVRILAGRYQADPEVIEQDVNLLVERLRSAGSVEIG